MQKIDELINGHKENLALPIDSKNVAPPISNTNEKTQSSSTPYSPDQKQPELPPALPVVNLKLQYERIHEMVNPISYVKYVPQVYVDHPIFNFTDEDYEISVKDKAYLKSLLAEAVSLSEKEFERILDCIEKVSFMYRSDQPTFVAQTFEAHADDALKAKLKALPPNTIQNIVTQYWKKRKIEQKWHAFYRKFWQNPDYNEPDLSAAFRKISEKEKIKTRPKIEIHKKKH